LGKFPGAIISLLGIGFFAMPAGLLSAGFIEEIKKKRTDKKCCPKCGEALE
jgi:voltage-gated potassium channel